MNKNVRFKLLLSIDVLVLFAAVGVYPIIAAQYGLSGVPSLDDTSFIAHVVFASSGAPGTPKARFAYLFPNRDSSLVQVRLRPDVGEGAG